MSNTVTINMPAPPTFRVEDLFPGMMFTLPNKATTLMAVRTEDGRFRFVNLTTGSSSPMSPDLLIRRIYRVTVESDDG